MAGLGTELAEVLRASPIAQGVENAYIVGYFTGLLNDLARQSEDVRETIEYHINHVRNGADHVR